MFFGLFFHVFCKMLCVARLYENHCFVFVFTVFRAHGPFGEKTKLYKEENFSKVISITEAIENDEYESRYMFLRALSFAGNKDTLKFKNTLEKKTTNNLS